MRYSDFTIKKKIPGPLTGASSPSDLLEWLDHNVEYDGVCKGRIYTPAEVVAVGKGHCWETASLVLSELTQMGYTGKIVYLETPNLTVTHSTTLYSDGQDVFWFEWAWYPEEGIHGPFTSYENAIMEIIRRFTDRNGKPSRVKCGNGDIIPGGTEEDYINMINQWNNLKVN